MKAWSICSYYNSSFCWVLIGAILTEEQRGSPTEQLFKYAVERINRDPELLSNTTLIYDIHYVDREDSWHASKKGNEFVD